METSLLTVELGFEQDVVLARQRARQLASELGFDGQDQIRVAVAMSEVARDALQVGKGSRIEFYLDSEDSNYLLMRVSVPATAAEVPALQRAFQQSDELAAARRIMDVFRIEPHSRGLSIVFGKLLPRKVTDLSAVQVKDLLQHVEVPAPKDIYQEFQAQNQELMQTLAELRRHQAELAQVNAELEETNRGVVALYAELEEKADSLRKVAEQRSRFYSSMSHEFRTPINSILSLCRILLDRLDGDLTEEQEKQVGLILKSGRNLLEWVDDILDLAKVDAGRMEVRPVRFTVSELLAGLRGVMRPLLNNPQVTLAFEDAATLPSLYTDDGKLSQILRNFISNALKFTTRGEVRVAARVAENEPDSICVTVQDTGIGIRESDLARIFDEFTQIDNPLQSAVKGTGLGLALSKRLAELLGGRIEVTSKQGVGSRFSVIIPREYPQQETASTATAVEHAGAKATSAGRPKVLLVDDDDAARALLRNALAEFSVDVVEARSGEEGLQVADAQRPTLIFLDLSMPGMHGLEVMQRLRVKQATARIPIIIHSAQRLDPADRQAIEQLALCILNKSDPSQPPSVEQLSEILVQAGLIGEVSEGSIVA